jgi:hypothetical protein
MFKFQWCHDLRNTLLTDRPFDVANDCLPTVVYMHVLDADKLLTSVPQASKHLSTSTLLFSLLGLGPFRCEP